MATGNASGKGIVLSRLSKSYGQVRAVRSLDLAIAGGETVALLGPEWRRQDHDHRHGAGPEQA